MDKKRNDKFNALLKDILARNFTLMLWEIQNDFGLITINKVELASDMWYLDVFVSSLKWQEVLCKTLALYAQDFKQAINREITLRKTPIIRFLYDDEMEKTTQLMKKINDLDV